MTIQVSCQFWFVSQTAMLIALCGMNMGAFWLAEANPKKESIPFPYRFLSGISGLVLFVTALQLFGVIQVTGPFQPQEITKMCEQKGSDR